MKYAAVAAGGAVVGAIALYLVMMWWMPSRMVNVYESPYGLEETVKQIERKVEDAGWKIPKVYNLQKSLADAGYDVPGIRVFSICNPKHAHRVLGDESTRFVSSMMPCRIAVYEHGGGTRIASMNIEMMSGLFGGEIEAVMTDVDREMHAMLGDLLREI